MKKVGLLNLAQKWDLSHKSYYSGFMTKQVGFLPGIGHLRNWIPKSLLVTFQYTKVYNQRFTSVDSET